MGSRAAPHIPRLCLLLGLAAALVSVLAAPAGASEAGLEPVGSFDRPTYVTSDPLDPNRLFVVEQGGRIELVGRGGHTTFLDIEPLVHALDAYGDYGLLSMAFSPDYASDHLFYVLYTAADDPGTAQNESGDWQLDEFRAGRDEAEPASRRKVLTIPLPTTQFHYGGQLQLGPDGYLYASTGDGGPQGDPEGKSQNLTGLFGKILRIDPGGSAAGEYTVPADNPFAGTAGCADGCDEIWSYGLRNPWRFSFDRLTGDLAIGDVGYGLWEEVDFAKAPAPGRGANFGWSCREGAHPGPEAGSPGCVASAGTFTEPFFEYPHLNDPCDSITGGYVVRDRGLPDLYGRYLYADFCAGEIRSLDFDDPAGDDRSEGLSVSGITSFGEDAACRIYVASFFGPVYRLSEPNALSGCSQPASSTPPPSSSNAFTLGVLKRDARWGTATLMVSVPGPGEVTLWGDGVKGGAAGAVASLKASAAGDLRLLVRASGRKRQTLHETGRVKLRAHVTFSPTGGYPSTQSRKLKLKRVPSLRLSRTRP